jgi:hypothetical protein
MSSEEFHRREDGPVKFCHIDASHDYRSVRETIELLCHALCAAEFCLDTLPLGPRGSQRPAGRR